MSKLTTLQTQYARNLASKLHDLKVTWLEKVKEVGDYYRRKHKL